MVAKKAGKKRAKKRAGKPPKRRGRRANGRPRLVFDLERVAELGELRVPYEHLARDLGCCVETISARMREGGPQFDEDFSRAYHTGRAVRNIALREKQYRVAMAGSEKLLIHLGKHELDQGDKVTHANDSEHPITDPGPDLSKLSSKELRDYLRLRQKAARTESEEI